VKKDWREYPKGYLEARDKYLGGPDLRSLWIRLRMLRNIREGFREFDPESGEKPPVGYLELAGFVPKEELLDTYREYVKETQKSCAEFESEVLKAVYEPDVSYLKNLLRAIQAPTLPEPEMDPPKALLIAFDWLFIRKGLRTREQWPNKKAVKFLAARILGYNLTERQWTDCLKKAGLWELPRGT
jgi:hypothetical protein